MGAALGASERGRLIRLLRHALDEVVRAERLARELGTPLAGFQLCGDMLADGLGDPGKMRDDARRMRLPRAGRRETEQHERDPERGARGTVGGA